MLEVVKFQYETISNTNSYKRDVLDSLLDYPKDYVLVISGIRRCGKSTLVSQMLRLNTTTEKTFYLNFDTPQLYGFRLSDFAIIDEIIKEGNYSNIYFDEIQIVAGWEIYVRGKLDEGKRIVVTGSNATMLSRELGTKLTGRHISKELFPFSFQEFCGYKSLPQNEESFKDYLHNGGMPRYVATNEHEILEQLVNDIIYRDIAVRYGIKDDRTLKMLISLLISNIGNLITASKLKQPLGVKSTTTVSDYFSFLQQSYLFEFIPKFSYSIKAQIINPKKVYCIDNGIISVMSPGFTTDEGHKLENSVYIALRRTEKDIYYFNEGEGECDFIVTRNGAIKRIIQVCSNLNTENREREVNGLVAALTYFNLNQGEIITLNQRDTIFVDNKRIDVKPFYETGF